MRSISRYVTLAYLLSWACWLPILLAHRVVHVGGWPTHLFGLWGPGLAAIVTAGLAGRGRVRALVAGMTHWRIGAWWLVALSPLVLLAVGLFATGSSGTDTWRINGFPIWGPVGVLALLVLVNGLGEETGWRGYLQPALQRRMRPLFAMLLVALVWAGWHAPLFAIMEGYRGFTAGTLIGFFIGLASGAIVLGWLYNRTGSVLAVAVWHATYNLASASVAARGPAAALATTAVILAAVVLVVADLRTGGRTLAPVAHIPGRTAWTARTSPPTRGRSTPTAPSVPR
jgi:CAAX protease family protein